MFNMKLLCRLQGDSSDFCTLHPAAKDKPINHDFVLEILIGLCSVWFEVT